MLPTDATVTLRCPRHFRQTRLSSFRAARRVWCIADDTLKEQHDKPALADTKTLTLRFVDWRNSMDTTERRGDACRTAAAPPRLPASTARGRRRCFFPSDTGVRAVEAMSHQFVNLFTSKPVFNFRLERTSKSAAPSAAGQDSSCGSAGVICRGWNSWPWTRRNCIN